MRFTLRNFAAALATIGLLSFGSAAISQQDVAESTETQPPAQMDNDSSAERSDSQADADASADANAQQKSQSNDANAQASQNASSQSSQQDQQNVQADADQQANAEAQANADRDERDQEKADANSDKSNDAQASADSDKKDSEADKQASSDQKQSDQNQQTAQDTPDVPQEAQQANNGNSDINTARDADWRMVQHNGGWWYYAPNGNWQYYRNGSWTAYNANTYRAQGDLGPRQDGRQQLSNRSVAQQDNRQPHSTAYRGEGQQSDQGSQATELLHDSQGRAYICENGQKVYVQDSGQAANSQPVPTDRQGQMNQRQYQDVPASPTASDSSRFEDGDNVGRPTPVRPEHRSTMPAPPTAEE